MECHAALPSGKGTGSGACYHHRREPSDGPAPMTPSTIDDLDLDEIVRALYAQPQLRHAIEVESDEDVGRVRQELESSLTDLYGSAAQWGRGIKISVEGDDDDKPHRVWMWRSLVGAQRTARDGFSGEPRAISG